MNSSERATEWETLLPGVLLHSVRTMVYRVCPRPSRRSLRSWWPRHAAAKVFIVDPIREYRQVRRNVSRDLVDYGNLIANPGSGESDRIDEAEATFRGHASELKAAIDDIPLYGIWARLRLVPPRDDALEAKRQLVGLSNSLQQGRVGVERRDAEQASGLARVVASSVSTGSVLKVACASWDVIDRVLGFVWGSISRPLWSRSFLGFC